MKVYFDKEYLRELYVSGKTSDKSETVATVCNITELSNHYD